MTGLLKDHNLTEVDIEDLEEMKGPAPFYAKDPRIEKIENKIEKLKSTFPDDPIINEKIEEKIREKGEKVNQERKELERQAKDLEEKYLKDDSDVVKAEINKIRRKKEEKSRELHKYERFIRENEPSILEGSLDSLLDSINTELPSFRLITFSPKKEVWLEKYGKDKYQYGPNRKKPSVKVIIGSSFTPARFGTGQHISLMFFKIYVDFVDILDKLVSMDEIKENEDTCILFSIINEKRQFIITGS